MNYWLVKGNPAENNDFQFIRPRTRHTWRTKRPPRDWNIGDRLLFWASSPWLELIALGEFLGETGELTHEAETIYEVKYLTRVLARPLGIDELRADSVVADASFLKSGPAHSVFRLSEAEGVHLYRRLLAFNGAASKVWPGLEGEVVGPFESLPDIDDLALDGDKRLLQHFRRERSRALVRAKKASVLQSYGRLACEVCKFDFRARYGSLGDDFCEVHHRHLAGREISKTTHLDDLAVVCSNCHRMLHKAFCSLDDLRARWLPVPTPPPQLTSQYFGDRVG